MNSSIPGSRTSKDCRDAKCARCLFLRNRETWEEAATLYVNGNRAGAWLVPCLHRGRWGLRCWVCAKTKQESEWSSGTVQTNSLGNIRRHGKSSQQHQSALQASGFDGDEAHIARSVAPDKESFGKVLSHRRSGKPLQDSVPGVGGRWKTTKMQFCLAEAARENDRCFLKAARSIALKLDPRAGMLLVRYTGCDQLLNARTGLLGHKFIHGKETATGVRLTLKGMVEDFCTSGLDDSVDTELKANLAKHVELLVADAASTEQTALRMSKQDLFPSARLVQRDPTHAMTRRPLWARFVGR